MNHSGRLERQGDSAKIVRGDGMAMDASRAQLAADGI